MARKAASKSTASKYTTALRVIEADLGKENADTFHNVQHPDLCAVYVLANSPFNDSDTALRSSAFFQSEAKPQVVSEAKDNFRKDDDVRWKYGTPPKGNANFAWVQHFIHHLAPTGMAGFVLANGSMSSNQSGEGDIRKAIIEADLVDCMVALPGQLFYSTQIPVCLWFLTKNKGRDTLRRVPNSEAATNGTRHSASLPLRDRRKETLFIDARKMGSMVSRVNPELTEEDIRKIADTYHAWRSESDPVGTRRAASDYSDIPGFCKSATTEEIASHGHVLTPGRYVGAEEVEDDGEPFEEKMPRLVAELNAQFAESAKLEAQIRANLKGLGYEL